MMVDQGTQRVSMSNVSFELIDIKHALQVFEWVFFSYILCELNENVDVLSKEAQSLLVDLVGLYEFID